jgi:methionyl-tRNA synthetase
MSGAKMSKSLGNTVDPNVLSDKYGVEAIRYYLMSDITTGKDADFSEKRLIERYQTDLANNIGNLLNRSLTMTNKYRDGHLTKPSGKQLEDLKADQKSWNQWLEHIKRWFDEFKFDLGLANTFQRFATGCNIMVESKKPWILAKKSSSADELDRILFALAEHLRVIAIVISPVLPRAAHGIFDQLNWKMELSGKEERFSLKDAEWGGLPDGHVVGKPVPLFPRIESK